MYYSTRLTVALGLLLTILFGLRLLHETMQFLIQEFFQYFDGGHGHDFVVSFFFHPNRFDDLDYIQLVLVQKSRNLVDDMRV